MEGTTLFHEQWWLSAVSGGRHEEVIVEQGRAVVARLAFVADSVIGFRRLRMPAFTHVLGPYVVPGKGKPQTELTRRISFVRSLIDKLPAFDFFKSAIEPSAAGGLAIADGLAFQERGFLVKAQYNYRMDCRIGLETIWNGMDFKTRQHIRSAERRYAIEIVSSPEDFAAFYLNNLARRSQGARFSLSQFRTLFSECRVRSCGQVLVARPSDGSAAAMTFLVWDDLALYYLLSTRTESSDSGAVSLLIWHAMQLAHELGICFDFDGVSTSGTSRFYAGFGGQVCNRLIVTKSKPAFATAQYIGGIVRRADRESSRFT